MKSAQAHSLAAPKSRRPITSAALRAPLSSHQLTNGLLITETKEKAAAQMPAIASLPPRLWIKNGKVGRLIMWLVKT